MVFLVTLSRHVYGYLGMVENHPPSTEKVAMFNQEGNNHKNKMIII